jgi:hypothetical protein
MRDYLDSPHPRADVLAAPYGRTGRSTARVVEVG